MLAPLRFEARALSWGSPSSVVIRTGAGPRRAGAAASALLAGPRPRAVAIAGVAGGLIPGLAPGTVVVADRVLDQAGATVAELPSAVLVAAELRRRGLTVLVGPIISTDRIVRGAAARAALAAKGAVAVDLETVTLLRRPWDAPVTVVRTIADTPEQAQVARHGDRRAEGVGRPQGRGACAGRVGSRRRRPHGGAGRAPVVLRRRRTGHPDRRAGDRPLRRPGVRAPPDRAQPPRSRRPRAPRCGVRGGAGRGS